MEPSDGSSPDDKSMTYGDDILTHWKHPMAVSKKTGASGGGEYKILNRPPIAHRWLFPNLAASTPLTFVPPSHDICYPLNFSLSPACDFPTQGASLLEGVCLVFEQDQFLHWLRKLNLSVSFRRAGYCWRIPRSKNLCISPN